MAGFSHHIQSVITIAKLQQILPAFFVTNVSHAHAVTRYWGQEAGTAQFNGGIKAILTCLNNEKSPASKIHNRFNNLPLSMILTYLSIICLSRNITSTHSFFDIRLQKFNMNDVTFGLILPKSSVNMAIHLSTHSMANGACNTYKLSRIISS